MCLVKKCEHWTGDDSANKKARWSSSKSSGETVKKKEEPSSTNTQPSSLIYIYICTLNFVSIVNKSVKNAT